MNHKTIFLLILSVMLLFACGKKSTTAPDSTINENLIGYWHLVSYTDEDGLQDYSGFMEITADREISGQFADEDETATFSGRVETTDTIFKVDIKQSNALWIETGKHDFSYAISGNQLRLEGLLNDEDVIIIYSSQGPNPDEFGTLNVLVLDADTQYEMANALVSIQQTQMSGYTDFNGSIVFLEVPTGEHTVQVTMGGYDSQAVTVTIQHQQTTSVTVELQSQSSGVGNISGFVADALNQVLIAGATISILGTSYQTQSAENGFYYFSEIPIGTYDLKCVKTGFEEQTSSNQNVISDDEINVDFILLPEGSITYGTLSGMVTNSQNGAPVPNVVVQIVGLVNSALTYNDGSYEVVFVPAGTYDVTFTKVGYETVTESNILIENGNTTMLNGSMNLISGTSSLAASVTNTFGLPLSGVLLEIIGTELSGTTGVAGFCTIQNIPAGMYDVRASKSGFATQIIENVEFISGIPRPLEIVMQTGK
jgi:hypothetical protein